ncbi:P-loop containing nucleoside triphosphate hydrolase protein [Armillaria luteobubalina]|uniref:P-loop containing nucleoside triphosphate hydrolase protein n=1 Tax=Armillaria luteobubalina TaxID=153913 RepID=A0AA39PZG1_9AGAR|nr:P-loop containing nucleoside triphosphate hydrolase protein [Armillaria luteobubalina]
MQGLWSNHRRSKLNLNASPAETSPLPTPQEEQPAASVDVEDQPAAQNGIVESIAEPKSPQPTVNGKRKVRSSRPVEEGSKRAKLSSGAASSISKDYSSPTARLSDLGGVEACVEKMLEMVAMPLCHPEVYLHTGVQPPRGVLLHGPPGCGKTLLANAMAGELGVPFINISAPSIVSGMSGESEKTLRDAFEEAKRVAPCILFIDEIDAITPKRESAQREMERRIVAQFLTCMDDMSWEKNDNKPVIVMGATNRPDSLDAALRRAGRFDHEISMGVPDDEARERILRVLSVKLRIEGDFNFAALAKATPGYVGADLSALTAAAGIIAVKRIFKQLSEGTLQLPTEPDLSMQVDEPQIAAEASSSSLRPAPIITAIASSLSFPTSSPHSIAHFLNAHPDPLTPVQLAPLCITSADFTVALTQVQPSSKREGFATVPDVSWSDIGALHRTRDELHMAIVQPIKRPELFSAVGIEAACGVLLWGPPGCGKTLLAKAVANESRANFISVKGPELLNKYVGESERAVRQVFSRARASSPCVIFFDELDALVPRRDDSLSESSARVVNTLLTELDGLDARKSVYVIAATNRPDMIDPAMVRPGRLDKLLYVDLPNGDERAEIVRTMTRKVPLARCHCLAPYTWARERPKVTVHLSDFSAALEKVGPSVSPQQKKRYEALKFKLAGSPVKMVKDEVKGVEGEAQA